MQIILASSSPRRKQILSEIYTDFITESADIDEENALNEYLNSTADVRQNFGCSHPAQFLALRKLEAAAQKLAGVNSEKLLIAADTMVECAGQILNKPSDAADAERMLRLLSGRVHEVCTGIALQYSTGKEVKTITGREITEVKFRNLSTEDIQEYLTTGEWKDKAGAYGIQGKGGSLTESIKGDYLNVVGFPRGLFQKLRDLVI